MTAGGRDPNRSRGQGAVTGREMTAIDWQAAEVLRQTDLFVARRSGRFLLVELLAPHRVVSTCAACGGQREDVSFLANHQSCEGTGDAVRYDRIAALGPAGHHAATCAEMGVPPERTALMGTAANMAYAASRSAVFDDLRVDAFATAGVAGNAARAGDPARWMEDGDGRWRRVEAAGADGPDMGTAPRDGTINVILLLGCPVTPAAQARAAVTLTEAKSAALAELAVPSRYSPTIATGTGTDQICLAAPLDPNRTSRTATGPHAKLGELIGTAVREAVNEALRWQNGLEPSLTRGLFHALGRFGLTEARALARLAELLPAEHYALLDRNRHAVFYEPGVAAAAYALAAVLDRAAFGTLPPGAAGEALRQQAACLACALAARPLDWPEFRAQLAQAPDDPVELVLRALAAGWSAKWT